MTAPAFLLPLDPLSGRRPDPHFLREVRLVRELGGVCHLLDHDALVAGDAATAVRRLPDGCGPLWYRGWMVGSRAYGSLVEEVAARGGTLLTGPEAYTAAHELPGWYGVFEALTPASARPAGGVRPGRSELAAAALHLGGRGPGIVKDFVKSRKHEWHEACFVPELADTDALCRVVARFVDLQAEDLTGGVVLRRFEEFERGPDGSAVEARVWWLDGEAVLVGPHPDLGGVVPEPDLSAVRPLVRRLLGERGCRFVTTDLARRVDGTGWRVVEVGDGQVSDLPRGTETEVSFPRLFSALLAAGPSPAPGPAAS